MAFTISSLASSAFDSISVIFWSIFSSGISIILFSTCSTIFSRDNFLNWLAAFSILFLDSFLNLIWLLTKLPVPSVGFPYEGSIIFIESIRWLPPLFIYSAFDNSRRTSFTRFHSSSSSIPSSLGSPDERSTFDT